MSREYLWLTFGAYGLDLRTLRFRKLLYSGHWVTLRISGFEAEPFLALRGITQGCHLSAVLFSIALDPWSASS